MYRAFYLSYNIKGGTVTPQVKRKQFAVIEAEIYQLGLSKVISPKVVVCFLE